ncbi:MAG: ketose-bisphosphate aldolase [Clostridiales bacterium GWC2_40_7]|nr:MAG: ketose-bisphosphate aldolase [Clostridiales bacterium GWC2_40_7]
MLVPMKMILDHAADNNYAVIAASGINMEMMRALISSADEKNAPLIIIMGGNQMAKTANPELLVPVIKKLASETPSPIAICLDHGRDFVKVAYAVRNGFTSIMIDASAKPIDENIALTKKVVELCHPLGISVEGELGHVGMADNNDGCDESRYTRPEEAVRYINETEVDCLAIAAGTAHGKYPGNFIPKINFSLIKRVKEATNNMPIVLHGSSGSGDENIIRAVQAGINKINVATDLLNACKTGIQNALINNPDIDYLTLMQHAELSCRRLLDHWIDLSGSSGKAVNFLPKYDIKRLQGDFTSVLIGE